MKLFREFVCICCGKEVKTVGPARHGDECSSCYRDRIAKQLVKAQQVSIVVETNDDHEEKTFIVLPYSITFNVNLRLWILFAHDMNEDCQIVIDMASIISWRKTMETELDGL